MNCRPEIEGRDFELKQNLWSFTIFDLVNFDLLRKTFGGLTWCLEEVLFFGSLKFHFDLIL